MATLRTRGHPPPPFSLGRLLVPLASRSPDGFPAYRRDRVRVEERTAAVAVNELTPEVAEALNDAAFRIRSLRSRLAARDVELAEATECVSRCLLEIERLNADLDLAARDAACAAFEEPE